MNSANFALTEFSEVRLGGIDSPKIVLLSDALEPTSLLRCCLVQAGRGLEARPGEEGRWALGRGRGEPVVQPAAA